MTVKNVIYMKKIVWNPATCSFENGKYLARIMDASAIMYDEVIESHNEDADAKTKSNTKTKLNS